MNSYGDPQSARARAQVPGPTAAPDRARTTRTPDAAVTPGAARPAGLGRRRRARRTGLGGGAAAARDGRCGPGRPGRPRSRLGAGLPAGRVGLVPVSRQRRRLGWRGSCLGAGSAARGPAGRAASDGRRRRASVGAARSVGRAGLGGAGRRRQVGGGGPGGRAARTGRVGHGVAPAAARTRAGRPGRAARAKRRKRTNMLIAGVAVFIMLAGVGVVGGTYFFDQRGAARARSSCRTPRRSTRPTARRSSPRWASRTARSSRSTRSPQTSARGGRRPRTRTSTSTTASTMKGIARAAWNNFTGGDTQGASTITQQYARHAAELKDITLQPQAAGGGHRLQDGGRVQQGRDPRPLPQHRLLRPRRVRHRGGGARPTSARPSVTPIGKGAITPAEAAILAAVIKQPEPSADGHQGYDPANNPDRGPGPLELRASTTWSKLALPGDAAGQSRPAGALPDRRAVPQEPGPASSSASTRRPATSSTSPAPRSIKYVKRRDCAPWASSRRRELTRAACRISTTIDNKVQKAAEKAANRATARSRRLHGKPEEPASRPLVAIDPKNGRVLAYYGGPDGDRQLGLRRPELPTTTATSLGGGRPPGSTFKIYTLLAALRRHGMLRRLALEGPRRAAGRRANSGSATPAATAPVAADACTLRESTMQSLQRSVLLAQPDSRARQGHRDGAQGRRQLIGRPTEPGRRGTT